MDKQKLSHLIEESKKGSAKAMVQMLLYAYSPVSFQCRKLLNDPMLAEDMSEKVLRSLASNIIKIENIDHLHK